MRLSIRFASGVLTFTATEVVNFDPAAVGGSVVNFEPWVMTFLGGEDRATIVLLSLGGGQAPSLGCSMSLTMEWIGYYGLPPITVQY